MKKVNNTGFMLIETLIVTMIVASVLIYLYIQFTNLNRNYNQSFEYNTVEGLYALEDVKDFMSEDSAIMDYILNNMNIGYIDITDCTGFSDTSCPTLLGDEKITTIIVTYNDTSMTTLPSTYNTKFRDFFNKINYMGDEEYRLVAEFQNGTFATLRFEVNV